MTIERASSADLAMSALSARGRVPEQFGVLLRLARGTDAEALQLLVARRLGAVPRLRRRLVAVPPLAGRPVWVDEPGFEPGNHVDLVPCAAPGDDRALMDLAAALACTPLDRGGPRWSATVVDGLADGPAVVVVLDHVVADGIGGLAVLARLVDPGPADDVPPPQPRPSYRVLVAEATRTRWASVRRLPAAVRALRASLRAAGGLHPPRAADCSLLAPTGERRTFGVATADLAALHAAAAAAGGTVNDVVLVAVTCALRDLLEAPGESVPEFRVAVVVTERRAADVRSLGNAASPLMISVPAGGPDQERLRRIAGAVRRVRSEASGPAAIAVLGPLFRVTARLGLYRAWLRRQRRLHTLVSNVPGPPAPVSIGGALVTAMVPFGVGDGGNVTVSFDCLSYAGTLAVTAVADPGRVPDLAVLTASLQAALDELGSTDPSATDSGLRRRAARRS